MKHNIKSHIGDLPGTNQLDGNIHPENQRRPEISSHAPLFYLTACMPGKLLFQDYNFPRPFVEATRLMPIVALDKLPDASLAIVESK